MTVSINEVWQRIKAHQGEEFTTKTGLPFTYRVAGAVLWPSRTDYNLAQSDFAKALALCPLPGPGKINNLVRGPAYVWAILHDSRIRGSDW